jgi:hypothetical protein
MRRTHLLLAVLVIVGALNRNTAGILILFFASAALVQHRLRREMGWIVLYSLLWLATTAFTYAIQGAGTTYWTLGRIFAYNLRMIPFASTQWVEIGLVFLLGLLGVTRAPRFFKLLLPGVALYGLLFLVFGAWTEVRVLIPILPIVCAFGAVAFPDGEVGEKQLVETKELPYP